MSVRTAIAFVVRTGLATAQPEGRRRRRWPAVWRAGGTTSRRQHDRPGTRSGTGAAGQYGRAERVGDKDERTRPCTTVARRRLRNTPNGSGRDAVDSGNKGLLKSGTVSKQCQHSIRNSYLFTPGTRLISNNNRHYCISDRDRDKQRF